MKRIIITISVFTLAIMLIAVGDYLSDKYLGTKQLVSGGLLGILLITKIDSWISKK